MSTPPPPQEPDWPSELGPYTIERPVTRRAATGRDLAGRPVWLHWSPCSHDPDDPCGAEREYASLSTNPARSVPEVLDLVRQADRCWAVTDVIEGVSLAQAIVEGREVDVERVAADLLAALRRAHFAGWVHGDIKPANVMLRPDGSAVLVDWELAARVGRPSPPGSLGYAPPHAWEGGYRAETRNDTYGLAVLLAELLLGERLFTGDRATVIATQQKHRFGADARVPDVVRRVYAAADDGVGAEGADVPIEAALLDVRIGHVVRLSAVDIASAIVSADRRGASAAPDGIAFEDQGFELAEAVAARWRTAVGGNALVLRASQVAGGSVHQGAAAERPDDAGACVTPDLARRLANVGPGVIVVDLTASEGEVASGSDGVVAALSCPGKGSEAWHLLPIDTRAGGAPTIGATRAVVRQALQALLATSHVSGPIVEAVVSAKSPRLDVAVSAVADLGRSGGLVGGTGHVEIAVVDEGSQRRTLDSLSRNLSPLDWDATRADGIGGDDPASLDRAECLLARGETLAAYPILVRATTELLFAGGRSEADAVRVADLWLEHGSTEAAAQVLGTCERDDTSLPVLRRLGRVAATRGDEAALRRVAAQMVELGCDPHDPERARFIAIAEVARNEFGAAHEALRGASKRESPEGDRVAVVELLATWGTVQRRRGRTFSGERLLTLARRMADDCGASRVALRIDAKLLEIRSIGVAGAAAAIAWADLAVRCKRWGFGPAARRHFIRAAGLYLQADDLQRAQGSLTESRACRVAPGALAAAWRDTERYVCVQIQSRRDEPLDAADPPRADNRSRIAALLWLACELSSASTATRPATQRFLETSRSRAPAARLCRLVLRWVNRGGDASARLARVVRQFGTAFSEQAPAVGALARLATRSAGDDWPLVGLLAVLRDALEEDEAVRELALAFHASAFVWSGVGDMAAAAWLRSHAPEIDEARPFGLFAWEWRLAMLRADVALGHEPDVDARLEHVLDALESWCAALDPAERAERMAIVPYDAIAATAGLAGPETLQIPEGAEALVAFRAHLRREAVRFRGSRGRAAGLERVLHSALRLRAGCTIEEVLRETVSGVLAVCRAERAVVVFEDASGDRRAKLATLESIEDVGPSDAEVSESAIEHARRQGRACIFDDACGNAEFGDSPSVRMYRPRSLMIAPLQAHGKTLGYLYVENRSLPKSFSPSDLQLLEGFASQAGMALENARLVEELRSSLEELKRVRTEAVRAESLRVLGQMAGEVAHDFNNLLAVILGETQLLLQDRPGDGIERSLDVIERAAMDGAAAIRRIQSSTRARPREEFAVLDLGQLVREVLDFTRVRWASGGADPGRAIRTRCRSGRGVYVSGLAPELREVFTNLVLNAVDAMPEGGDLLVSVRGIGDAAEVAVRDTGRGIPAEIVERVFDPFFSTKGEGGNGLGLAIAKEIVERHGGRIAVTSGPGLGTTLTVRLPLVEQPTEPSAAPASPAVVPEAAAAAPRRSVLVVDDEEGVLRVLSAMLRAEGFIVTAAASGEEATRRLEGGERYDVVITDLYMPGTSGVEVIETTRRTAGARRVVVMSGYGDVVGEGRIPAQSVDGVLSKPFTLSDVRAAVN